MLPKPYFSVGVDKFISQGRFLSDVRSEQLKIGIVAGVVVPLVCLLYMCCIGMLLLCRERHLESIHATDKQPKRYCNFFGRLPLMCH